VRPLKAKRGEDPRHLGTLQKPGPGDLVLGSYFADIMKYEPLSAREEQELFRKYRGGDRSVKDTIVYRNLKFVVMVAKQYSNQGVPLADLISEGNSGLLHAVDRFDPNKNFKFISYAVWWIRQSILQAISKQSRHIRIPLNQTQALVKIRKAVDVLSQKMGRTPSTEEISIRTGMRKSKVWMMLFASEPPVSLESKISGTVHSIGESLTYNDKDALEELVDRTFSDDLVKAFEVLSLVERKVLVQCFGLDGGHEHTLNDVGVRLGISRERVRQLRNRALKKLRKEIDQISLGESIVTETKETK